ncbi:MAG: peroxiredoxin-like family protein [Pseudomonadota bacterium]
MKSQKLKAGAHFPEVIVPKISGGEISLGAPNKPHDWRLVVVYRGMHCPICTRYLSELNAALPELNDLGIDLVAVSADPKEKAEVQMSGVKPNFDVGYDLTIEQMKALGLYISNPRSAQETDRPFAEPGLFVINAGGAVQVTDISNAPFARTDLKSLIMGLGFIRNPENNYPIRGTH